MAVTIPVQANLKLRFTGPKDDPSMRRVVEASLTVGEEKLAVVLPKDIPNALKLGDLNVAMPGAVRTAVGELAVQLADAIIADSKFMEALVGLAQKQAEKSPTARGERI